MDYTPREPINCNVKLLNKDLWNQFNSLETEMIITKPGRRMFPSMRVQIADLDPQKEYCLVVEMAPASKCRFRYTSSTGWAPAGSEEAQSPNRLYVHPESPAPGHHWMSQAVSFGRLKLTNTTNPPRGHVVMSSMHKYQPKIHIIEASDVRMIYDYCPSAIVAFPETQFIAVTAYQNDKMTKMKIDHNPFAKGFRESGQSKCKRKMVRLENEKRERERSNMDDNESAQADEEIIIVDDVHPAKRTCPSPAMNSSNSSESGMSDSDRSTSNLSSASLASPQPPLAISSYQPSYGMVSYSQTPSQPISDMFNPYYFGYSQFNPYFNAFASMLPLPVRPGELVTASVQDLSLKHIDNADQKDERINEVMEAKFTDFSIKTLIGCT